MDECEYLLTAVYDQEPLSKIQEHLLSCKSCEEELERIFACYENKQEPWLGAPIFPRGIESQIELLERWLIIQAGENERAEFSRDITREKLDLFQVMEELKKLNRRQTRGIQFSMVKAPRKVRLREAKLIESSYRKLHEIMGPRAFWHYFRQNNGEGDLEALILWWRVALLGTRL